MTSEFSEFQEPPYCGSGKEMRADSCYGLAIVYHWLKRRGFGILPYSGSQIIPMLWSCYWPEQLYDFIRWRLKVGFKGPIIAGGNVATTNPSVVLPFVDFVFAGDGELWNGTTEQLIHPESSPSKINIAEAIVPIVYTDLRDNKIGVCELSRGCKNKCLFCQYGWLKPYREAGLVDVVETIAHNPARKMRFFAADRLQHSHYVQIMELAGKRGKCDVSSDTTIRYVLKNKEQLAVTKKVRIGIEGMSERIRAMIAKPALDDQIVEFFESCEQYNVGTISVYMIYGLPTETDEDAESYLRLISRIDRVCKKGRTVFIHFNAFQPNALTPMQWCKPAWNYPKARMTRIFSDRRHTRIKLAYRPLQTSDARILSRMLIVRGSRRTADLIFTAARHPKWLQYHQQLLDAYRDREGANLMDDWPRDKPFPWDEYLDYDKTNLATIARKAGFITE
jgi:radical SAM superfamily enzyme YgiQ (UPF0313 family)